MKMSKVVQHFEHLTPKTIKEALSLLATYNDKAKVIAGGTDLLVLMKNRDLTPAYIINLKAIPDLDYIQYESKEGLRIGNLTTIGDIEKSTIIGENFSILLDAARQLGSIQIRNTATLIGNLCRCAPSADMAPPLIALGAKAKIVSLFRERVISLDEFFIGPGESVLASNDILTEIQIPNPPPHTVGTYLKMQGRAALGIALVGAAVLLTMDVEHNRIGDAKIVLGAVAPTPIRATQAEDILKGKVIEDRLIREAVEAAVEASKPISDIRCTGEYRRKMIKVLVNRAIRKLVGVCPEMG